MRKCNGKFLQEAIDALRNDLNLDWPRFTDEELRTWSAYREETKKTPARERSQIWMSEEMTTIREKYDALMRWFMENISHLHFIRECLKKGDALDLSDDEASSYSSLFKLHNEIADAIEKAKQWCSETLLFVPSLPAH